MQGEGKETAAGSLVGPQLGWAACTEQMSADD